jgi:hypothetical protein
LLQPLQVLVEEPLLLEYHGDSNWQAEYFSISGAF